ncbi:hypothetical protein BGX34_009499 [Mortierella sp. NVP85]|nr:hypothetical protein BGX34_009499 [Mortierella sp. NVP85]
MSVAIVAISQEHGYTKSQQGLILASFFFGYILTPILGGALADRYGGKHVLGFDLWRERTSIMLLDHRAGAEVDLNTTTTGPSKNRPTLQLGR